MIFFRNIRDISRRELHYIFSDPRLRLVVLMAPLLYLGLFCLVFSNLQTPHTSLADSNFLVPGLLMAILQQAMLLGIPSSWTAEKENQTLNSLFEISRHPWALIFGKALPYVAIYFIIAELFLRVLLPLSNVPTSGQWLMTTPFTFLFIFTVVMWGMWLSGLCKTRLFATQILTLVALPSFVISGFTWPAAAMPAYAQILSKFLPVTYFVNSFQSVYQTDASFSYVAKDFAILGVFAGLNVYLAYRVVRWMLRPVKHLNLKTAI
jgi:ABC-2 type transport system permease protein